MRGRADAKICGVCGDKALGFNFNAVTCESCKAFFRRNALVQREFRCPFSNQCEITTVTRRFCQKCRLDKCFAIGMCKDLIMTEEDKVLKRLKVEENRAKKRNTSSFKSGFKKAKKESMEADSQDSELFNSIYTDTDSKDTSLSDGYQPNNPNIVSVINYRNTESSRISNDEISSSNEKLVTSSDDFSSIRSFLTPQEANNTEIDGSSLLTNLMNNNDLNCNNNTPNASLKSGNSNPQTLDVTKDVVKNVKIANSEALVKENGVETNPIESILCEAIKLEYEAYSSIAQCQSNSRELNDAERAKLNELIVANKALVTPLDEEINNVIGDDQKFKIAWL